MEGRTNNVVEGHHDRLRKIVNKCHPSMFSILGELQKEQRDMEVSITQMRSGQASVRQNKSRKAELKGNRISPLSKDISNI